MSTSGLPWGTVERSLRWHNNRKSISGLIPNGNHLALLALRETRVCQSGSNYGLNQGWCFILVKPLQFGHKCNTVCCSSASILFSMEVVQWRWLRMRVFQYSLELWGLIGRAGILLACCGICWSQFTNLVAMLSWILGSIFWRS